MKPKKLTLSEEQFKCLSAIIEHGKLIKYPGSFWSKEGVDMIDQIEYKVPAWYYGNSTIKALLARELIVAEFRLNSYTGKYYPVEAMLSPKKIEFYYNKQKYIYG